MNKILTRLMVALSVFAFCSCSNKSTHQDEALHAESRGVENNIQPYVELDQIAHAGVIPEDSNKALRGDASAALEIAIKFADLGKDQEARYWYQIAAENGSPIGMQHFSVFLRKADCLRANFWLKKYLSFDDSMVSSEDRKLSSDQLITHEKECDASVLAKAS
jgi:TPR repeat protein